MKKMIRPLLCAFLVTLCFACPAQAGALPLNEAELRALSEMAADAMEESSVKGETIAALTSLIVMCNEQLEEYDRSSSIFVAACITFIGAILGVIITLYTSRKNKDGPQGKVSLASAALFLILPAATTLCLYVFSMQCRRVVFFRGYILYLEDLLNELTGVPVAFTSNVALHFFGVFPTNQYGPLVMAFFIFIVFCVCGVFLHRLLKAVDSSVGKHPGLYKGCCWLVFTVCILFCAVCARDLMTNNPVPEQVRQFCIGLANNMT